MTSAPWIQTASGTKFPFLECCEDDISIVDIARGLSNECRWARQAKVFYSVAQHSVLLSMVVPEEMQFYALLHDAHEAYLGDCPRPLKHGSSFGTEYIRLADRIQKIIESKYMVVSPRPWQFLPWDNAMGLTEMRLLMPGDVTKDEGFLMEGEPLDLRLIPWTPQQSFIRFSQRFKELYHVGPHEVRE